MWGDYYLDTKKKKIFKDQYHEKAKPMFVQFVLDSIWKLYETIESKDMDMIGKMSKALKIDLPDNFQDALTKDQHLALQVILIYLTLKIVDIHVEVVTNR